MPCLSQEYSDIRADVALKKSDLLPISVPAGTQPCAKFGVHPALPSLKTMFDDADALFVAGVGTLIEPLSKADLGLAGFQTTSTKAIPPALYAHNKQVQQSQNLHAQSSTAKGVIGRIVDVLTAQPSPYKSQAYSITGNQKIVEGLSPPDFLHRSRGVERLAEYAALSPLLAQLSAHESQSAFADTWAGLLDAALAKTEVLGSLLDEADVNDGPFSGSGIGMQLYQVARVVSVRGALEAERDFFMVSHRARSHCRSALTLARFIPDSLPYSVPLFLKRQCGRTPRFRSAASTRTPTSGPTSATRSWRTS
jgi:uncharacterized protein (DUF1501 family)